MRIGVLAAESGWHFQDLVRAASDNAEEGYELSSLSFSRLSAEIAGGTPILRFSCQQDDLAALDRLIVRTMPAGSLQQIVFGVCFTQPTGAVVWPTSIERPTFDVYDFVV